MAWKALGCARWGGRKIGSLVAIHCSLKVRWGRAFDFLRGWKRFISNHGRHDEVLDRSRAMSQEAQGYRAVFSRKAQAALLTPCRATVCDMGRCCLSGSTALADNGSEMRLEFSVCLFVWE